MAISSSGWMVNAHCPLITAKTGAEDSGYKQIPATNEIKALNKINTITKNIVANNFPLIIFQRLNGRIASNLIVPLSNSEAIKLAAIIIANAEIKTVAIFMAKNIKS